MVVKLPHFPLLERLINKHLARTLEVEKNQNDATDNDALQEELTRAFATLKGRINEQL